MQSPPSEDADKTIPNINWVHIFEGTFSGIYYLVMCPETVTKLYKVQIY